MIEKMEGCIYGYHLVDTTNEEWRALVEKFEEKEKVRCVICNATMRSRFRIGLLGQNILTINNKVPDDVVFLNRNY